MPIATIRTVADGHPVAVDFANTYQIALADSPELRARVFRLRCSVFCQELGFAMKQEQGLEADSYDDQSLHCLLTHRASGEDIGCIRLVLPRERGGGLPFEGFGLRYVDRKLLDWKQLDPRLCCEVSRLAVSPTFRHRPTAGESRQASRAPVVAISLYHAVIALILDRGYESVFMVIEPRLGRHLQRYGIQLQQISPEFEHYGSRATFVTTREQLLWEVDHWRREWRGVYDEVHHQLLGWRPSLQGWHPDVAAQVRSLAARKGNSAAASVI